jgi:hypothetical protein
MARISVFESKVGNKRGSKYEKRGSGEMATDNKRSHGI